MAQSIDQHEGRKYLRTIFPCTVNTSGPGVPLTVNVDVYAVLEAFRVTCPARAHAIKKLLCAGLRGKGDELTDLIGADAAVSRAIELQKQRDGNEPLPNG